MSTFHSTTERKIAAPRRGVAPLSRGKHMPCPSSMTGCIEVALSGRSLQGNVGGERRPRSPRIDVEGGQVMQGYMAIHPADGSTARLSGGCRNRRNSVTACGVDSPWSAYPGLVERPRRERRAVAWRTWRPQEIPCRGARSPQQGYVCLRGPQFPRNPVLVS